MAGQPNAEKDILWLRKNLEEQLYRAFKASFPFFSYKEVKTLVKAQYYRLLVELRQTYSWEELEARLDTTQQGLRKLGDAVSPRLRDNEIRVVLHLIQQAGEGGVALDALAARFYGECGARPGRISLDEILRCLQETGDVSLRGGRYHAGLPELDLSTEAIRALLVTLQARPDGLSLPELAAVFFALSPRPSGDFDASLECLLRVGDVVERDGRMHATQATAQYAREGRVSQEVTQSIANTASRIGELVARGPGARTAGLWRVTLNLPDSDEASRAFLARLREAVAGVIQEFEQADPRQGRRATTVVLGAAAGVL